MTVFFIHKSQLFISILQVLVILLILRFSPFAFIAFSHRLFRWLGRSCFYFCHDCVVNFKFRWLVFNIRSLFINFILIKQRCCTSLKMYWLGFFCFIDYFLTWIFDSLFVVSLADSWDLLKVTQFEFLFCEKGRWYLSWILFLNVSWTFLHNVLGASKFVFH